MTDERNDQGIKAFGPRETVQALARQIESWVDGAGLTMSQVEIAYSSNRAFYWPGHLNGTVMEAHTALVTWSRRL
jgi:hypothetical protein